MTELEYILLIRQRIDSEFRKYANSELESDWPEIAARKIYHSLFSKADKCPICDNRVTS